jgi:translation initiation factor IF-2
MAKKYKLFKVAKELNVASDTLKAFLEKKGVQVKGPNTSIEEDIYAEILEKFSLEKEKAEKLQKKRERDLEETAETVEAAQTEKPDKKEEKSDDSPAPKTFLQEKLEKLAEEKKERIEKRKAKLQQKKEEAKKAATEKPAEPKKAETGEKVSVDEKTETEKAPAEKPVTAPEAKTVKKEKTDKKPPEKESKPHKPSAKETEESEKRSKKQAGKKKSLDKSGYFEKRKSKKIEIPVDGAEFTAPKRRRKKKKKQAVVDQQEVENNLKKTLAQIGAGTHKKRKKIRRKEDGEIEEIEENVITVTEFISAQDLASLMDIPVQDVIKKSIEMGMMITINQRLDLETIQLIADEFEFVVEEEKEFQAAVVLDFEEEEDKPEDLVPRPPVVTIMGHVDHGKTSLLDFIRKSNVVDSESGGITQHIGAYQVDVNDKKITFIDTPGHEAFTAMRARGAKVTDVAIIVVAADDAVMPQTVEAIDHAKSAEVPMIFAINKMDKPGANPDKIFQQLADRNILVEDWGGSYQVAKVSAKKGEGIDELLEKVLLEAEMLELRANPERRAKGVLIESRLDKGKGAMATVLIQNGTLKIGDTFVAGQYAGKVRAMYGDRGEQVKNAGPSVPVQVIGFDSTPQAGDVLIVTPDERSARELSAKRQQIKREQDFRKFHHLTLDDISYRIKHGEVKELNILVKGDVDGSVEALSDALMRMSNEEVAVNVVRKAVGQISEADVMLAAASKAIIIGFHVRPSAKARELAEHEKVDIRTYPIIYDAIEDIKKALEGLLSPEIKEQVIGHLEVRDVFKISKVGSVAGCYVTDGRITRQNPVRLIRDGVVVYEGTLSSLKRFQDDVTEVKSGFECGLMIQGYNDIKVGDEIEVYETFEEKRKL